MRVGIVGLGLIGRQRLDALSRLQATNKDLVIVGCVDPYQENVPHRYGTVDELLEEKLDLLFVAVPHREIYGICQTALKRGVRVHVEKPLGTSLEESRNLALLDANGKMLTVGFNYRFFHGVLELLADIRKRRFGDLIRIDFVIGHGGSPADLESWKLDPVAAGGGSLLDPGIHLLDLVLLITDKPRISYLHNWKGFWNTGIDEESTVLLTSDTVPLITVTSSIVRWRSEFAIKVVGKDGYGYVQGRGRSYGPQRYIRGERWGWSSQVSQEESEILVTEDNCEDSFEIEIQQLLKPKDNYPMPCTSAEALHVMELLFEILS